MTIILKTTIYILNFLILGSIITFTILFYFQITVNYLTSFIIIISITTLLLKLLYWYLIRRPSKMINTINRSNAFLLRLAFCIFTYITPTYYILQQPSLVISNYVILVTLIIISILAFVGIIMERYLFFIESNYSLESLGPFYEKNNLK